jgi:amidohydrolase
VSGAQLSAPAVADAASAHLDQWLHEHGESLIQLRRYVHAHPELSGAEQGTAMMLAERLAAGGLAPLLLPTGNGVICDLGSGPGPAVALRADLDALPLPDTKDVPYRSTVDGVCHACGHDVHSTVVVGAGLALASLGAALPGRVRLVLQPSEETFPSGSLEMINAGCLSDVGSIFAVHCDPRLDTGLVGLRVGPLTAAADMIRVRLTGAGGHTARPHLTADLVGALGRVVTEVPAQLARRIDPRAGLSLVFGAVHAGVAANAIPQQGSASGTVRVLDRAAWEVAPKLIEQLVHDVVAPTGAVAEVEYTRGVPPVVNEPEAVAAFAAGATAAFGAGAVVDTPQSMGGEDFSWYLEQVPGAMARLGVGRAGEERDLHQGNFDVDERAIENGVRLLYHTVLRALAR